MLIDDVKIKVSAGRGGDGVVAFTKTKQNRGPVGANGGRGGNVYIEAVGDLSALNQFRYRKELKAPNGKSARTYNEGAGGKDFVLKVPVGTVVHNLTNGNDFEMTTLGQKVFLAKGGVGGKGNFYFRASINTTPMEYQEGTLGEEFELRLELKLIANIGLLGLPNAGKSSLLNALTRAQSKVANYPFTTLDPNLGVYYGLIIADIPGIIEGASKGKGLGIKFLRHIERTATLFHLISAESENPLKDYKVIRDELGAYNKSLLEKKEYVFLSKADILIKKELEKKLADLKEIGKPVIPISIIDDESLKSVKDILNQILKQQQENAKI